MAPGAPVGAAAGGLPGAAPDGASAASGPGAGGLPGRPVAGGRTAGPAGPGPFGPCRPGAPGRAGAPGGTGPPCRTGGPQSGAPAGPPVRGIPGPGVGGPGVGGLGGSAWESGRPGGAGAGTPGGRPGAASPGPRSSARRPRSAERVRVADVGAGVAAAAGCRCGVVPCPASSAASGAAGAGCGAVPSGATSSTAGASADRSIDSRGVLRRLGLVDGRGRQGHHGRAVRPPGRRPRRRSHPGRRDPLPPAAGAVQPRDALDVARGRDPAEVAGAEHQARTRGPGAGTNASAVRSRRPT